MSQIVTRKGPVGEDKEKRQTDSPVKEMKKKIAANAEKEKQAAEKNAEKSVQNDKKTEKDKSSEKAEKAAEKPAEKKDKAEKLDKSIEKKDKPEKNLDKSIEKKDKAEKAADKKESSDKKENSTEKADKKDKADKKEASVEKASDSKEKNGKPETNDDKQKKPEAKAKENGTTVNGNGTEQNGDTVSSEESLQSSDELFPELAYDDSDVECFEPPTPEGLPSRSYTRRSQVKATRTPETPRPASEKNTDKDYVPDDSKLLKLKDDNLSTDRKLRSADSPKPQDRKIEKVLEGKKSESPKKDTLKVVEEEPSKNIEVEVEVVEVENEETRVKSDTNYSKSRVRVSPYRRSGRLADNTDISLVANYTGNNTTMEMDITESSIAEDTPESPYLSGLRSIRARRSYRPLKEMTLRNISVNRSARAANVSEQPTRPTGTVVGRKRRQDAEDSIELAAEAEAEAEAESRALRGKRPRLLERLARPFRAAPPPARRAAEIVGINTDLPLTAPVASPDTFDPEAIKPLTAPAPESAAPAPAPTVAERDSKRCIVM